MMIAVGLATMVLFQVLVNMLVNAGQATQPGGVVRLSTRGEEEGIRVEVRDTGAGSPYPGLPRRRRMPFEMRSDSAVTLVRRRSDA